MTRRIAISLCLLGALASTDYAYAERGSYAYQKPKGGTAIDIKEKRHTASEYPNQHAPWNFRDRIAAAAPTYPLEDRARRHQGTGFFRIIIDPKTGGVIQVTVVRSTGYATLDACAVAALRRWRWKRGTWKEVDLPVTFENGTACGNNATTRHNPSSLSRKRHLTNRWSQPLASVKSAFNFIKQFSIFAALAPASGGSALSR